MNATTPSAAAVRALLEQGRVDEAAAVLGRGAAGAADEPDVAATLRAATGCSAADAAWAAALGEDPSLLDDEDVTSLLAFLARRLGLLRVEPAPGAPQAGDDGALDVGALDVGALDVGDPHPAPRGAAWASDERRFLLARWRRDGELRRATSGPTAARHERRRALWRRLYVDGTPLVPLVRHPRTLAVVRHSFDPYGVDGPWWEAESRHRPDDTAVRGWLGATGGILDGPRPTGGASLRWLLSPASGRLLDAGATGVLRRLTSGTTTCDVAAWFDLEGRGMAPAPELGRSEAVRRDDRGRFAGYATVPPLDARDDLADALASGRLRWIATQDEDLELRTGVTGCPFVDPDGRWVGAQPSS